MEEVIAWAQAHYQEVLQVGAYVIAGASIIVKLTPTPADDAFLAKIVRLVGVFALNPKK